MLSYSLCNILFLEFFLFTTFLKIFFKFYVYGCLAWMCMHHVSAWCPQRPEDGNRSSAITVTGDCELSNGCHVVLPVPPLLVGTLWQPATLWASTTPALQKSGSKSGSATGVPGYPGLQSENLCVKITTTKRKGEMTMMTLTTTTSVCNLWFYSDHLLCKLFLKTMYKYYWGGQQDSSVGNSNLSLISAPTRWQQSTTSSRAVLWPHTHRSSQNRDRNYREAECLSVFSKCPLSPIFMRMSKMQMNKNSCVVFLNSPSLSMLTPRQLYL